MKLSSTQHRSKTDKNFLFYFEYFFKSKTYFINYQDSNVLTFKTFDLKEDNLRKACDLLGKHELFFEWLEFNYEVNEILKGY